MKARQQRREALARLLDHLEHGRREAGHILHKGICQELTAANLLLSLLTLEQDNDDLRQLTASMAKASVDLRRFLDQAVGPAPVVDLAVALRDVLTHFPEVTCQMHGNPPLTLSARAQVALVHDLAHRGTLLRCRLRPDRLILDLKEGWDSLFYHCLREAGFPTRRSDTRLICKVFSS